MVIYTWLMNFLGINNTYNDFSTHMYNFWSGFGGNISILALIGALLGVYRHNLSRMERLKKLEQLNPLQKPIEKMIKRVEEAGHDNHDGPKS
jgi:hypothetical protein